jgi:hypothetical protein
VPETIKKVVLSPSFLTEINWEQEGYLIRYRIKTENKNLTSHWSPVYRVPVPIFESVPGSLVENLGEDGQTVVSAVWDDVLDFFSYDIYVASRGGTPYNDEFVYDEDFFHFHGTTQNHNYSFVKLPGSTVIRVIVQPSTNIKKIKQRFIVFDSDNPVVIES